MRSTLLIPITTVDVAAKEMKYTVSYIKLK